MRVRQLQTYILKNRLQQIGRISKLAGLTIAVDVVAWLRTLGELRDPIAQLLGGAQCYLERVMNEQIAYFERARIHPIFVFPGVTVLGHALFSPQPLELLMSGCELWAQGDAAKGESLLMQGTSRVAADILEVSIKLMKLKLYARDETTGQLIRRNFSVLRAPTTTTGQITNLSRLGIIDGVLGQPGLVAMDFARVILSFDFPNDRVEWLERSDLLEQWGIDRNQLLDACLMAGADNCLTLPWLDLPEHNEGLHFQFSTAVEFARHATLQYYMMCFQASPERRGCYASLYALQKSLATYFMALQGEGKTGPYCVQAPTGPDAVAHAASAASREATDQQLAKPSELPAINGGASIADESLTSNEVSPSSPVQFANNNNNNVNTAITTPSDVSLIQSIEKLGCETWFPTFIPYDFAHVAGYRLPDQLYLLMEDGYISPHILSALSLGEWNFDYFIPGAVDEHDKLTQVLKPQLLRAAGLVAQCINPLFSRRGIAIKSPPQQSLSRTDHSRGIPNCEPPGLDHYPPDIEPGLSWTFNEDDVKNCMSVMRVERCDIFFCLRWQRKTLTPDHSLSLFIPFFKQGTRMKDLINAQNRWSSNSLSELGGSGSGQTTAPFTNSGVANPQTEISESSSATWRKICTAAPQAASAAVAAAPGSRNSARKPLCFPAVGPQDIAAAQARSVLRCLEIQGDTMSPVPQPSKSQNYLICLILFIFLENIGYISSNGQPTMFGLLVSELAHSKFQEEIILALELVKLDLLHGDPLSKSKSNDAVLAAYAEANNGGDAVYGRALNTSLALAMWETLHTLPMNQILEERRHVIMQPESQRESQRATAEVSTTGRTSSNGSEVADDTSLLPFKLIRLRAPLPFASALPSSVATEYSVSTYAYSCRLVCRALSLIPVARCDCMQNYKFDIADPEIGIYASLVRRVKTVYRVLVEGCIAHVLLQNFGVARLITPDMFGDFIPTFAPKIAALGSVAKFLMMYSFDGSSSTEEHTDGNGYDVSETFVANLEKRFEGAVPGVLVKLVGDGLEFWCELYTIITASLLSTKLEPLARHFTVAHELLMTRFRCLVLPVVLSRGIDVSGIAPTLHHLLVTGLQSTAQQILAAGIDERQMAILCPPSRESDSHHNRFHNDTVAAS